MSSQICVDSGVLLKLLLPEPDSHLAEALWHNCLAKEIIVTAPQLLPFELTAVMRKVVHRGLLAPDLAARLLLQGLALAVELQTFSGIHEKAWALATRLNQSTAYDAHYLALAEHLGCPFWTADKRLYNSVHADLPWVNWLGNFDGSP